MSGFLDGFRKKIVSSVWKDSTGESEQKNIDDKIALGVLLWVVAEADKKFLPQEQEELKRVLTSHIKISGEDMMFVLASIQEAAKQRIDLYTFTHQISNNLPHVIRVSILEDLFRVACIDRELDSNELEIIRKISGLFRLSHDDFIQAKIKIKKEFGLDTAGL